MATTTRRSAKRGQMAQKRFESVKGFCKAVALEMKEEGVNSEYFADVFIGYLADSMKLQKADGEAAADLDKRADTLAAANFAAMLQSEEGREKLAASDIYKAMASADEMYKVFRASLPCYSGTKFSFAKEKAIAFAAADLEKEKAAEYESKETYHKIAVNVEGRDIVYYCSVAYSAEDLEKGMNETRSQRRAFLKPEKEAAVIYQKSGSENLYTLLPIDKANYKDLARALSAAMQEAAAAIIRRRAAEAEAAKRNEKAAAAASAFLNQEAAEKLADLQKIADNVETAKAANKYGAKVRKSAEKKAEGIAAAITTAAEKAAAVYAAEITAANKDLDKYAAEITAANNGEARAEISEKIDSVGNLRAISIKNREKAEAFANQAAALLAAIKGEAAAEEKAAA